MKFSMKGHERARWPFITGDCLIEVAAWAGLIVVFFLNIVSRKKSPNIWGPQKLLHFPKKCMETN